MVYFMKPPRSKSHHNKIPNRVKQFAVTRGSYSLPYRKCLLKLIDIII